MKTSAIGAEVLPIKKKIVMAGQAKRDPATQGRAHLRARSASRNIGANCRRVSMLTRFATVEVSEYSATALCRSHDRLWRLGLHFS